MSSFIYPPSQLIAGVDDCVPEKLVSAVDTYLQQDNQALLDEFSRLHQLIRCDADKQAAQAVVDVLQGHI